MLKETIQWTLKKYSIRIFGNPRDLGAYILPPLIGYVSPRGGGEATLRSPDERVDLVHICSRFELPCTKKWDTSSSIWWVSPLSYRVLMSSRWGMINLVNLVITLSYPIWNGFLENMCFLFFNFILFLLHYGLIALLLYWRFLYCWLGL